MLVYLGICAVLAFLAALGASFLAVLPAPTFWVVPPPSIWHIVFAAGALPLICGAIIHFVPVLTRSATPTRGVRMLPLVMQGAGIVTPIGLAGVLPAWTLHAAGSLVALVALFLSIWVMRRMRSTLGAPHPGTRWYGAALLCLFFAVSLVPIWLALPGLRSSLRLFHLHLNTLGFIGLAALGTLPVLVPTAMGRPDVTAARRLLHDLPLAAAGAVLVAAGAASGALWLGFPGALLLCWVAVRNLMAWLSCYGFRQIIGDGVTASLAAATLGFILLLLWGLSHGFGWAEARPSLAGFGTLFLLPLVTGALSQLLPVWHLPGNDSELRQLMRRRLARSGAVRAMLFLLGGGLLAIGVAFGAALVGAGLLLFVLALLQAFWLDSPQPRDDNSAPLQ